MAMAEEAIRDEVLVDRPEVELWLRRAARPRHAARGVDDHAGGIDEARAHERCDSERRGGDVTTCGGDERCAAEVLTEELGDAERRVREQFGAGVLVAVP